MLYPYELAYPRARPPLYAQFGRIKTNRNKRSQSRCGKDNAMWRILLPYFREYCNVSSVHGIRYLTDSKLKRLEKLIWLLLLIATSIGAIMVYIDLNELYNSVQIQTTIEDTMRPMFYAPYPAVGLCLNNRINLPQLKGEATNLYIGNDAPELQKELFRTFFSLASDARFEHLEAMSSFFENTTLASNVGFLDNLNVANVLQHVSLQCNDFLIECNWRGRSHNCCEIFDLEHTEAGLCWVFNSVISPRLQKLAKNNKFYPRRTATSGQGTGLDVILRLNSSLVRPDRRGIYVIVKHSSQWTDEARFSGDNTHTKISMVPRYTSTDERTRSISPMQRRCLFEDERQGSQYRAIPGLSYWKGNCRTRCHQEFVNKLCNCTPALFFPVSDEFPDCKPSQFKCLYDNRLSFRNERQAEESEYVEDEHEPRMLCDCINSCVQLTYDRVHSTTNLDTEDLGTMRVDVFYQSPWFMKYQTRMRFTFVELLANFGGIIGLFLGASLLSAIELVYYFTIGLYLYLHGIWKLRQEQSPQLIMIKPKKMNYY